LPGYTSWFSGRRLWQPAQAALSRARYRDNVFVGKKVDFGKNGVIKSLGAITRKQETSQKSD